MKSPRPSSAVSLSLCFIPLLGCKATHPSSVEAWTANAVKHHIAVRNRNQQNPLTSTSENIAAGKEAFSHYCVACHGMDGQNTGVPFANNLSPSVPSLASADVQRYTDGQLKWVIDNGIRLTGMPGSRGILSDEEIWSTILYIRHLPAAGSVGEPEMYQH